MTFDAGRRSRFEALASTIYEPLQRYLRRRLPPLEAEEVFAETLMTIWRRLEQVPEHEPLPWCYGVARRTLANHRRSRGRRMRLVTRLEGMRTEQHSPDPADVVDGAGVRAALAALPTDDQEVLRLWAWEALEPREIAQLIGTTPNAVSLRLGRAKKKLLEEMERQDRPPIGQKVLRREVHEDD